MSDENRFFRFVWRFNAMVIMLLLIAAVACIGWRATTGHGLIHWKLHDESAVDLTDHFVELATSQSYMLAPVDIISAPERDSERLYALNRYSFVVRENALVPFALPKETVTVNILVVDDKSKTSRWLFPHGDRSILSQTTLHVSAAQAAAAQNSTSLEGVSLLVVENDTNKDGKLNAKDRTALYLYRMDGKSPIKVLEADRIAVLPQTYEAKSLRLFYQDQGQSFAATYSLPHLELESRIAVAGLPQLKESGDVNLNVLMTEAQD